MRNVNRLWSVGRDRVVVEGSFRPDGSSGIVSGSQKGTGWSVARTSAGLYTVTFADFGYQLDSFFCGVRVADATPTICQAGDVVAASRTAQIRVLQAAAGGVTEPAGIIPLDIAGAREIESNDIPINKADETAATKINGGGFLSKDTVVNFERINTTTDPAARLQWPATVYNEVQFPPVIAPPDLSAAAAVSLKVRGFLTKAGGALVDSPALTVKAFQDVGDANFGGNTPTDFSTEAAATLSFAFAVGAVLPNLPINISIAPKAGELGTDHLSIVGAWLQYTKADWATTGQVFSLANMAADVDAEVDFIAVFKNTKIKNEK